MVLCNFCGSSVSLSTTCNVCGMKFENSNSSTEITFAKNVEEQSQASGNIARSVQSGISSSLEREIKLGMEDPSKEIAMDQLGNLGIDVPQSSKTAFIKHCIRCGLGVEECPCESAQDSYVVPTHKFGHKSFKLLGLPVPRCGKVLGIIGENNSGRTTVLKILAGQIQPNLGCLKKPPGWDDILSHFHDSDSELESYFVQMQKKKLKVLVKPELIGQKLSYGKYWAKWVLWEYEKKGRAIVDKICEQLELQNLERIVEELYADELQRFMVALTAVQKTDVYIFKDPCTFLAPDCYIVVIDHDLSVLNYVADEICFLYGQPGVYGVVSRSYPVNEGIDEFLSGYLRESSMTFEFNNPPNEVYRIYRYPKIPHLVDC